MKGKVVADKVPLGTPELLPLTPPADAAANGAADGKDQPQGAAASAPPQLQQRFQVGRAPHDHLTARVDAHFSKQHETGGACGGIPGHGDRRRVPHTVATVPAATHRHNAKARHVTLFCYPYYTPSPTPAAATHPPGFLPAPPPPLPRPPPCRCGRLWWAAAACA